MEERIYMSNKDLSRLEVLQKIRDKKMTFKEGAAHLGISERHLKRLSAKVKKEGPKELISKKVGMKGNHRLPDLLKRAALALIEEKYSDFGPTLAHEYLIEKEGVKLSVSSVRNLMIKNELHTPKSKRRKRVYKLRERRAQKGELVQADGSHHAWFEDRGPTCTLLLYVDDATTSLLHGKFAESESKLSYFTAMREYIELHGRPKGLYTDRHSVFSVNRDEVLAGEGKTQFARALEELDIVLILANSPQAKGRVERRNRDLQNRLVKFLRLHNIITIEEANAILPSFIEDFNNRFAKPARNPNNAHRVVLEDQNLDRIFCFKYTRILSKTLTFQFQNTTYQVITNREKYALSKRKINIFERLDGSIFAEYKGELLNIKTWSELPHRPEVVTSKEIASYPLEKKAYKPNKYHPWKRNKSGFSRPELATV